jgi:rhodanese-related sulfurtransferase
MPILLVLLGMIIFWSIRSVLPVKGLAFVDLEIVKDASMEDASLKMLDVRDAIHYQNCHIPGSINISIGRLPFVWKKELSPNEPILILSDSRYKSKRAARVLKKQGFYRLYALREMNCA